MILIILIILLIILAIAGYYILKYLYPQDYKEYVEKYSKMYGVEEELVYAMIKEESNFDKDANSHKSAIGLMQLVQDTADEVGLELGIENVDLRDPETNIQIGTKYLSDLIEKYDGNIKFAIVAYNAGFGNVDKWIAIQEILKLEKIEKDEVITIGDNINDLKMLKNAGLGIAMKGSAPKVIENANYVTQGNNEEGVANALEKYILKDI